MVKLAKSSKLQPKWIIGRTIVAIEMNARPIDPTDRTSGITYDPVFVLDNGARITFPINSHAEPMGLNPVYISPCRNSKK